ncbi:MAG: hypothetical protein ABW199_04945 [Caulobacterales bacterium]
MAEKHTILQITSGDGFWVAIEEGGALSFEPVVSFALIKSEGGEDGVYEEVVPLCADEVASGNYTGELIEMAGIVHASDFSELGVSLKPGRKPRKSS